MTQSTTNKQQEQPNNSIDESIARVQLAATYRLMDHFGWNDLRFNSATARVPGSDSHFLISPNQLIGDEVKASTLVKIDLNGNLVEPSEFKVHKVGFFQNSAIYAARPDITAILHSHSTYGTVVSTLQTGLLPIDLPSMMFFNQIAYHDFEGIGMNVEEGKRLVNQIGKDKFCMILRNHGLLVGGRSIAEAFMNLYFLEMACRTQVLSMSTGAPIIQPSEEPISRFLKTQEKLKQENAFVEFFDSLIRMLDRMDSSYRD
ncbi:MAG: class II aldolase/adducin family protein [Cyanobacteriota bacterium]|nr:class II aldolase/adducin family protein [Cyanobacteriota bacterium]